MNENLKKLIAYVLENEQSHYEETPSENHIYKIAEKAQLELNTPVRFDRVVTVLLDHDDLEEVNNLTGNNEFETDNWCDDEEFARVQTLYNYITKEQAIALINKQIDYIAFRLDC